MDSNTGLDTLNSENQVQDAFLPSAYTICYMSICLTCTAWQIITAGELFWVKRQMIQLAVLSVTILYFVPTLCSLLNPLVGLGCEFRYWVSILAVNISSVCVQSILLYKAYICHNRALWLLIVGSFINLGYVAFTFLCATVARVPTYKDSAGICILNNFEWPALVKLAIDIASNGFLSMAFLMVIYRYYRLHSNAAHKSLLSSGILFSVGVILSNIIVGILIATRIAGGLSSDLYCIDWVLTGYLLIKQFKLEDLPPNDPEDTSGRPSFTRESMNTGLSFLQRSLSEPARSSTSATIQLSKTHDDQDFEHQDDPEMMKEHV